MTCHSDVEGLEALHAKYAARGLVVLGFPSNDFKQQDADTKKTAELCFNTYGVKLPMFALMPVRGADAHPLFGQLAQATIASSLPARWRQDPTGTRALQITHHCACPSCSGSPCRCWRRRCGWPGWPGAGGCPRAMR